MAQTRQATPARWQTALQRALDGDVRVAQLESTGQWIATSASDPTSAYELHVTNGVVHGCTCSAAQYGDPVCCHRAAYWNLVGVLERDAPAPAADVTVLTLTTCESCRGSGEWRMQTGGGLNDYWAGPCKQCDGAGTVATELVAA